MEYKIEDILEYLERQKEIKIISFDIFDTLLFRTVIEPKDVFNKIGEFAKEKKLIPEYIDNVEFRNIRIEAEKRSREKKYELKKTKEVVLEEIYQEMPNIINQSCIFEIMKLELEIEKEVCYINPFMEEVIQKVVELNKKVILTSDMYLSKEQISDILVYNQMDWNLIEDIFVSSEYNKTKRDTELYHIVLSKYKVKPEEVLHIGDNYSSDIVSAKNLGMHTFYYDAISGKQFMSMELENLAYGNVAPEIYSLRNYVGTLYHKYQEDEKKWYRLGITVLGPLLSSLAEWVLNTAEENNIDVILPFMREGKLFAKSLEQAIRDRQKKISIVPAYVSRKSLFLASIDKWDEKEIEEIYNIKGIKIKEVFSLLKIECLGVPFHAYYDCILKEAAVIKINDSRLDIVLKEYLLSDKVKRIVEQIIIEQREMVISYIKELTKDKRFISVDIGFKGTIQTDIEQILRLGGKQTDNIHLVLFGCSRGIDAIFKGIDFRGFVGSFGKNHDLISSIYFAPYIFEQIMMCEEGTTVGYKREKNKIEPIIKETIKKEQIKVIQICQMGALKFQKQFLKISSKKQSIKKGILNEREIGKIATRLLQYPMIDEAELLGSLEHDENFGADVSKKICESKHLLLLKEKGQEEFFKIFGLYDVLWWQGLLVQQNPLYFFNKLIEDTASQYQKNVLILIKSIIDAKVEDIVIVGAGEAGLMIKKYLDLYKYVGSNIKVEAFVDNNKKLHGISIESIKVTSMSTNFKTNNFVIGSFAYVNELLEQIREEKGDVNIFYCR